MERRDIQAEGTLHNIREDLATGIGDHHTHRPSAATAPGLKRTFGLSFQWIAVEIFETRDAGKKRRYGRHGRQ
jgi:hypothetical protein